MTQQQADAAIRGIPTNTLLAKYADSPDLTAIVAAIVRRNARKAERKAERAAA